MATAGKAEVQYLTWLSAFQLSRRLGVRQVPEDCGRGEERLHATPRRRRAPISGFVAGST